VDITNPNILINLQKGFPDWEGRIEYEKKQRDLYNSPQNKLKMSPLGISSSKENLDQRKEMQLLIIRAQEFTSIIKKSKKDPISSTREKHFF